MPFNSLKFLLFLPVVFLLYWFAFRERKSQNLLIIAASYVFYGWWNWHCVFLIALTTACSYAGGILIERFMHSGEKRKAKCVNIANITVNIGILCYFKYFNFFIGSLMRAAGAVGWNIDLPTAKVLLPVGISFYTFQAIGYTIDVLKKRVKASTDPTSFFAYVCFFPQLVAGPIERARNLLPQFDNARRFDYALAVDGVRQMLWGYLKKLVIADNCAKVLGPLFASPSSFCTAHLALGLVLFFFQIYCDFSGYSDIAIGTAKLFGIRLTKNFDAPMFSRNIAEFWRKWHITLNSWFFDYVFFAMKGWNKKWRIALNVLVVFTLSGLWHGASSRFILWGLYFGILSIPCFLKIRPFKTKVAESRLLPSFKECGQMISTFILVLLAGPLFRCTSVSKAFLYYKSLITGVTVESNLTMGTALTVSIAILLLLEWVFRFKEHPFRLELVRNQAVRFAIILLALFCIFWFSPFSSAQFIYFDF